MGYGGKIEEQQRARELRSEAWTLDEIAAELGVAKSSVSRWVRGVAFVPKPRNRNAAGHKPHPARVRKLEQIEAANRRGRERFASLSDDAFFTAGVALYVGEGAKTANTVAMANTDPKVVAFFCSWLRRFFDIDDERLRCHLYLHRNLDLEEAMSFWSDVTGIPADRFYKPYRAELSGGRKRSKHRYGCLTVKYSSADLMKEVLGLCDGLLSSASAIRGSSAGRATHC